ncbi:acyltransferase family protein [Planotetraspora sp. GP83]|uniref:acyltransferase family protein n=1 Tax=Planotetraspora sp. GP83 TaxID=3156264 RepID=UPI0035157980
MTTVRIHAGNARTAPGADASRQRAQWADVAKGACIILVVLWHVIVKDYLQISWHAGLPVPSAWGTLGEQLLPLRMPLFFTISGVFAANAVNRPWRVLGRSRVAKFLYLYAVWLLIHTAILAAAPDFNTDHADSVLGLVEQLTITPSNLWYLYALAVYFAFAKAVRRAPRPVILAAAAALSVITAAGVLATPGDRGGVYQNLVFFLGGLYFKPYVERWAATATNRRLALTFVVYAAALTVMAVTGGQRWVGVWPAVSVAAVAFGVTAAERVSRWRPVGDALAALGRRTLPIYVVHMPLLALLHGFLVGPMSRLSGDGQALAVVGYPILLTAVVIGLSLAIRRGLLAARATWLFELPGWRRPAAPGGT